MENFYITKLKSKIEIKKAIDIRKKVFIEEQKVPSDIEIDGLDQKSEHFLAYLNNEAIGCARLRENKGYVKLERIAVLKEYRNKKYGKKITNFLINYCKNQNANQIRLHSQLTVVNFYKKFGFKPVGKIFLEAGIKHVEMYMDL